MSIERTRRWLVTALFTWRAAFIPAAFAAATDVQGEVIWFYLPIAVFLIVLNILLALAVIKNQLLLSRRFAYADALFTVALNLFTVSLLPPGTYLLTYRDTFWLYGLGTVGLATVILGVRTACRFMGTGFLLQIALALENHAPFTGPGWLLILARDGWLATGLFMPMVIMRLADVGAHIADAEGVRAGAAAERFRHLREMHDTALQTLGQITTRSIEGASPESARLMDIRGLALTQIGELRSEADDERAADLPGALRRLADDFDRLGLRVTLLDSGLTVSLGVKQSVDLLGSVREALTNTLRHAGVGNAVVRIAAIGDQVDVVVIDAGRGFDPTAVPQGFGIENSIRRRIVGSGGSVVIRSAPGEGTEIRMSVPVSERATTILTGPTESTDLETLTRRSLEWSVIAALAYRIVLSPVQAISTVANIGLSLPVSFWVVLTLVLTVDLLVLIGITAGKVGGLLRSRLYFLADVAVTVGLNVWAASILPRGTVTLPGREILWAYALGMVVFWTIIRGPRAGAALTLMGVALQAAMIQVNGASLGSLHASQLIGRQGYLTLALFMAWLLVVLARRSSNEAIAQGLLAGEAEERLRVLRTIHERVFVTLTRIVRRCDDEENTNRLTEIRGLALTQISWLRQSLRDPNANSGNELIDQLHLVSNEFRSLGLRVELVVAELTVTHPPGIVTALVDAVRAALANTWQHSGVTHAVVRAADTENSIAVVIRDHGRGFDPAAPTGGSGIASFITQRIAEIGGTTDVWSMPGQGTRVRLVIRNSRNTTGC